MLGIKLWLEEDGDLNRNDPLYSFKFIQSEVKIDTKRYHLQLYLYIQHSKLEKFCILVISNNKSFIPQNLKVVGPLGGKFDSFSPSGFEIQSDFDYRSSKIKFYSEALKL